MATTLQSDHGPDEPEVVERLEREDALSSLPFSAKRPMVPRDMSSESPFMRRAIDLARKGMLAGDGGPFGAVIVRDGEIIGEGWNRVIRDKDPTAHGEVSAIRDACSRLESFSLEGCEIHTTGEPCPMCLGAIHWARIGRIYYGFSIQDAATAGFDDRNFYQEFSKPADKRSIPAKPLMPNESRVLLDEYIALADRKDY